MANDMTKVPVGVGTYGVLIGVTATMATGIGMIASGDLNQGVATMATGVAGLAVWYTNRSKEARDRVALAAGAISALDDALDQALGQTPPPGEFDEPGEDQGQGAPPPVA